MDRRRYKLKLSDLIRIYESQKFPGYFLVLNPIVPAWIVTNRAGVYFLSYIDQNIPDITKLTINSPLLVNNKQVDNHVKEQIFNSGILQFNNLTPSHKTYFLNAIYLNMTAQCNLKCKYCYAETRVENKHSLLRIEEYKKLLDDIREINSNTVSIMFTGGEPLLNKNTIDIATYAKSKGFYTQLMTNGTLITDRNVDSLVQVFDEFRISVDGSTPEINDILRGSNSYERINKGIFLLKNHNAKFTVAMVVNKLNKGDIKNMQKVWGNNLKYQPFFPFKNESKINETLAITGEEYYNLLSDEVGIVPFSSLDGIIKSHLNNRSIHKCAMGDGELSISSNGDVYPCQLLHYPEFLIGNIKDNSIQELYLSDKCNYFKHHTIKEIDGCKQCDFRYLCGGACQARHYAETGSINVAGKFCEYEQNAIVDGLIASSINVKSI